MVANKNKKILFFAFYNFFVFLQKIQVQKTKKLKFDQILEFCLIFPNIFRKVLIFLKEKSIFRVFLEISRKSARILNFSFLQTFWWFYFKKFEFVSLLVGIKMLKYFFAFFCFLFAKNANYFLFFAKNQYTKKWQP